MILLLLIVMNYNNIRYECIRSNYIKMLYYSSIKVLALASFGTLLYIPKKTLGGAGY